MVEFYLIRNCLVITLLLPSLLDIGILISLPVRARECQEKSVQNNIHQDTQLDDGDLNNLFSYCVF